MTTKKRFDEIDLLKLIAIFMVVILHTGLLKIDFIANPSFSVFAQFGARILMEGVPIFVLVNGFLLLNKPYDSKKHFKKVRKIFGLVIVWAILNYLSGLFAHGDLSPDDFMKTFLTISTGSKYIGLLWFLIYLLSIYIIFPVIKSLHDNDKKAYNYLFKVVAFFTVGINLLTLVINFANLWLNNKGLPLIPGFLQKFTPLSSISYFLFCFMLGGYLYEMRDKLKKIKIWKVLLCGLASFAISFAYGVIVSEKKSTMITVSYNYSTIFLITDMVCLYIIALKYKSKDRFYNKIVQDIAKNSLGIYLIHIIIVRCVNNLIDFPKDNLAIRFCFTFGIFVISYVLVKIIRAIPLVKKLVEI